MLVRPHDAVDDQPHGEAHKAVDLAHPLAVALGQVVVDGDDVDPPAGEGVEVGGEGGHQGLALAGLHLGDAALVENDAADELHPVGLHAQHPPGGLPAGGKGLGQQVVQALAVLVAVLEFLCLGLELFIRQGGVLPVQGLDLIDDGSDGFDFPLRVGPEELFQQTHAIFTPLHILGFEISLVYHTPPEEKRENCEQTGGLPRHILPAEPAAAICSSHPSMSSGS